MPLTRFPRLTRLLRHPLPPRLYPRAQIYAEKDLLKAKLQVARRTRMAEFAIGIHHDLNGPDAPVPEG
jgi:hypothetical protein